MKKLVFKIIVALIIAWFAQVYYWLFNDVHYGPVGMLMTILVIIEAVAIAVCIQEIDAIVKYLEKMYAPN